MVATEYASGVRTGAHVDRPRPGTARPVFHSLYRFRHISGHHDLFALYRFRGARSVHAFLVFIKFAMQIINSQTILV
jgi:hypothetical protein